MGGASLEGRSTEARSRGDTHYAALAGEFYVLAELALRRLDGTLTLGHTKEIDILVLNRRTGRTFRVEVKATETGVRRRKLFGAYYSWRMNEKHEKVVDEGLVYCFVLLDRSVEPRRPRYFLVPSTDVAEYVRWEHEYFRQHAKRRADHPYPTRVFQIPAEEDPKAIPPSWRDERWRRYEGNWEIFGPLPNAWSCPA